MSPRPRFSSLDEERRRAILLAAAGEFSEHGFDAASYNRIIALSGVSKGAMYYYFDDKRDLYLTTLRDAEERASEAIGPLLAVSEFGEPDDPHAFWDALADFYCRITAFFAAEPLLAGLIKSAYAGGPVADQAYGEFLERTAKRFEEVLAEGIPIGAVRGDIPLDLLVSVTLSIGEAMDRWALGNFERLLALGEGAIAQVAERLLEMHLRLAAPLSLVIEREGRRASA